VLKVTVQLSPLGEACAKGDINAIHEILGSAGYMYDEGVTSEVQVHQILLLFLIVVLYNLSSLQKIQAPELVGCARLNMVPPVVSLHDISNQIM
jgi:hypothetical protein